jgi:D-alanyl-D-alanine carboxypeptidase
MVVAVLVVLASCEDDEPSSINPSVTSTPESSPVSSPSASPASLDEIAARVQEQIDARVADGGYPGAIVLVRVGDEERVIVGGRSRVDPATAMRPQDAFAIASITKPLVATGVLRLVEQGQLSLDDTVEELLPGLVPGGDRVTLEHLLSHQSGLADETDAEYGDPPEQAVRAATARPSMFEPGAKTWYANVNFDLLGLALQEVTGRPLSEVLSTQVFSPARMTSSWLDSPPTEATAGDVHGYDDGQDVTGSRRDWFAAGGAVSSARDLSRFLQALLGGDLLPPEVVDDMTTAHGSLMNMGGDYGLGIWRQEAACGRVIGHSGQFAGFATEAWALESGERLAIVMVNATDPGGSFAPPLLETALCEGQTQS